MKKKLIIFIAFTIALPFLLFGLLYLKQPSKAIALSFILRSELQKKPSNSDNNCTGLWSIPVIRQDSKWVPAFPETRAAYWLISFRTKHNNRPIRMEFTGQFPHARFMSFTTYHGDTAVAIKAIKDVDIEPTSGSYNPYYESVNRNESKRSYRIFVSPEEFSLEKGNNETLYPQNIETVTVILRVYRADDKFNYQGGVELPQARAFYADDNTPLPECQRKVNFPSFSPSKIERLIDEVIEKEQEELNASGFQKLSFALPILPKNNNRWFPFYAWHSKDGHLYPNLHIDYGLTTLSKENGDIVLIKFKAPTFPATGSGQSFLDHSAEVRYWSLCLGGLEETNTIGCISDYEAKLDQRGFVNIIIADSQDSQVANHAAKKDYALMPWGSVSGKYRVILRFIENEKPFPFAYSKVPSIRTIKEKPTPELLKKYEAHRYIGDYAARGLYLSRMEFLRN
jgi:hypothetical protein